MVVDEEEVLSQGAYMLLYSRYLLFQWFWCCLSSSVSFFMWVWVQCSFILKLHICTSRESKSICQFLLDLIIWTFLLFFCICTAPRIVCLVLSSSTKYNCTILTGKNIHIACFGRWKNICGQWEIYRTYLNPAVWTINCYNAQCDKHIAQPAFPMFIVCSFDFSQTTKCVS